MDNPVEIPAQSEIGIMMMAGHPFPLNYYSLREFCTHYELPILKTEVQQTGKKLSAMTEEMGHDVRKIFDERFGHVNSYHIDVLREFFKDRDMADKAPIYRSLNDQLELESLGEGMKQYIDALKRDVWISATGDEYKISDMKTTHIYATMSMLKRDSWPLTMRSQYEVKFKHELNSRKNTEDYTEQYEAAHSKLWKNAGGYIKYDDMATGHLSASIKWVGKSHLPDQLKLLITDGMKATIESRAM